MQALDNLLQGIFDVLMFSLQPLVVFSQRNVFLQKLHDRRFQSLEWGSAHNFIDNVSGEVTYGKRRAYRGQRGLESWLSEVLNSTIPVCFPLCHYLHNRVVALVYLSGHKTRMQDPKKPSLMDHSRLPNYEAIHTWLESMNASTTAAELHGLVCGVVCAECHFAGRPWIELIFGILGVERSRYQEVQQTLVALYQTSVSQLHAADETQLQILLPDTNHTLNARAKAVGDWCAGLMCALSWGGIPIEESSEENIRKVAVHLGEFAQIDYTNLEYEAADEQAYTQVVDYVRESMLLLYSEFAYQPPLHLNVPEKAEEKNLSVDRLH